MQQRLQELETELMQLHVRQLLKQASGRSPLAAGKGEPMQKSTSSVYKKLSAADQGIQLEVLAQAHGSIPDARTTATMKPTISSEAVQ